MAKIWIKNIGIKCDISSYLTNKKKQSFIRIKNISIKSPSLKQLFVSFC